MSNKSVRIKTSINQNNKYLNFKLDQNFDILNILSLSISQEDVYREFNSNYGVIVGRVNANESVGIPNARISIFIPVTEEDKNRPEIFSIYTYSKPSDVDNNGTRYNLLPRVSQFDEFSNIIENPFGYGYKPLVPVGNFPTKYETLLNENQLEVYQKYYKYTTVTNDSGDFMLFGVPVGTHTLHMSVDITDIGKFSMSPHTMTTLLGYSESYFTDGGTKVRKSFDLDDLPNVQYQEISVDVRPFWGDTENFEIGITRQDFKIRAKLQPSFVLFGSAFTMPEQGAWGNPDANTLRRMCTYEGDDSDARRAIVEQAQDINNQRLGLPIISILSLNPNISDTDADSGNFNPNTDFTVLDDSQYFRFLQRGLFCYVIPCNRKRIKTDEIGNEIEININSSEGILTEFRGCTLHDIEDLEMEVPEDKFDTGFLGFRSTIPRTRRSRFKIPQFNDNLRVDDFLVSNTLWRRKHGIFKGGEFYSVAQFYWLQNPSGTDDDSGLTLGVTTLPARRFNNLALDFNENCGILQVGGEVITDYRPTGEIESNTSIKSNGKSDDPSLDKDMWGGQWLNFTLFHQQYLVGYRRGDRFRVYPAYVPQDEDNIVNHFLDENTQNLGGGLIDSSRFKRADRHQFNFVNVPKADIIKFLLYPQNGFSSADIPDGLDGSYFYDNVLGYDEYNEGPYFSKGVNGVDCINLLFNLNLI